MFPRWLRYLSMAMVAMSLSWVRAFGSSSPAADRLLRLVPADAEIVAGIEDPHHGDQSGRLLIVTHNDNTDLQDWIALAGVDDQQQVDKLIEVAASSQRGELSEHLLLLSGYFDGARMLQAAKDQGGVASEYRGVRIVMVKPSAREQKDMPDTRWLAIIDHNIAVFGSPVLVERALDRYVLSSAADDGLMQQMRELKPDVNCWSVIRIPGAMLERHLRAGVLDASGVALMQGVSRVVIGIHYKSKERVDFVFNTNNAETANALATAMGAQPHLLPIADTLPSHTKGVSAEGNEVRGSVRVADKEFDSWLAAVYARLAMDPGTHGEVAHADGAR